VAAAEKNSLDAMKEFIETVNRALPDVGNDGASRQKIIDAAFKMTEQLVNASNDLANRVVKVSQDAAVKVQVRKAAVKKTTAKKAPAKKAAAKKAPAKKAAAKKAPAKRAAAKKSAAKKAPAKKTAAKKAR
jgi:hypothetical protein